MVIKRLVRYGIVAAVCCLSWALPSRSEGAEADPETQPRRDWLGVHMFAPSPSGVPLLKRAIAEVLGPIGINVLVLEVNYRFEYASHPELRQSPAMSGAWLQGRMRPQGSMVAKVLPALHPRAEEGAKHCGMQLPKRMGRPARRRASIVATAARNWCRLGERSSSGGPMKRLQTTWLAPRTPSPGRCRIS